MDISQLEQELQNAASNHRRKDLGDFVDKASPYSETAPYLVQTLLSYGLTRKPLSDETVTEATEESFYDEDYIVYLSDLMFEQGVLDELLDYGERNEYIDRIFDTLSDLREKFPDKLTEVTQKVFDIAVRCRLPYMRGQFNYAMTQLGSVTEYEQLESLTVRQE